MTATDLAHVETVEAMRHEHRLEVGRLRMQLLLYRDALVQAGLEPPDRDGEELLAMLEAARGVLAAAGGFVAGLASAKELLSGPQRGEYAPGRVSAAPVPPDAAAGVVRRYTGTPGKAPA